MGFIFKNLFLESILFLLLIFYFLYKMYTKKYKYWENRGVPCIKAEFPFGSLKDVVRAKTLLGKAHESIYKKFLTERFYGIIELKSPTLVVKDLELIKRILVKDFQHFVNKAGLKSNPGEYLLKHLANLEGEEWKAMRMKLTPTYTSGKLKQMFHLVEKCGDQLKEFLEAEVKAGNIINAKNILGRFTMDTISTCSLGIESNAIANENSEAFQLFLAFVSVPKEQFIWRWIAICFPSLINFFRVELMPPKLKDFLINTVRQIVEYRQLNDVKRNDLIDLLMNIGKNKSDLGENTDASPEYNVHNSDENLTIEQITAQSFVFLFGGFETSSSVMSFCIYELAQHQDIQERLYQVLREAVDKNGGKISYQLIMDLPFFDQVIDETLRLYGTAHILHRICTKPYKIPDSDLTVEKGVKILIPLYAILHDPQYYPEPYEFRPERFTPEESKMRNPFLFMPFGKGPRSCIAKRFASMQIKVGLATLILNFKVELSPDQEIPLKMNKRTITLIPESPILLKLSKRENK